MPGAPDPPELEAAACRGTAASLGVGRKFAGGAGGGGGWEGTEGRATAVSFSHSGFSHSVLTLVSMALLASPCPRVFGPSDVVPILGCEPVRGNQGPFVWVLEAEGPAGCVSRDLAKD